MDTDDETAQDSDDEEQPDDTVPIPASESTPLGSQPAIGSTVGEWFVERAKYVPVRLTLSERKYLRLLEAALTVSEYTDKIDTFGFGLSKAKRIVHQIRELCAIMSGLVLSADYKQGQELFADRDFQANEEFYQQIFEFGRRHKIMNPDKMRSTYGKLIYLLQVRGVSLINPLFLIGPTGQSNSPSQGSSEFHVCQTHQNCLPCTRRARCARSPSRGLNSYRDKRNLFRGSITEGGPKGHQIQRKGNRSTIREVPATRSEPRSCSTVPL